MLQLLDFSPLLMTGNELNPGDHLGGSEPQNHKLELRKVGDNKGVMTVSSSSSMSSENYEKLKFIIPSLLCVRVRTHRDRAKSRAVFQIFAGQSTH